MAQPYIGEIRLFAGNFAPAGWQFCDGTLLSIAENETLFQLIGTTYGGDGQQTFGVPDLRGRVPMHTNTQPLGAMGGVESVTLTTLQMPGHNHNFIGSTAIATEVAGAGNLIAQVTTGQLYRQAGGLQDFAANAVSVEGGSQPHDNLQPFQCINYIISLFGIFPSQS